MLAGIQRLYIALYSDLISAGFSCNGKRVAYSFNTGKDWSELLIARDSAIQTTNDFEKSLVAFFFDVAAAVSAYDSKKVVVKYQTNSGEFRCIGFDKSITLNVKFETGATPSDAMGYTLNFTGSSRIVTETIGDPIPYVPPVDPEPEFTTIKYGLIYSGWTILDPRGLAPDGWHIPSSAEVNTLFASIGNNAGKLKEVGTTHWNAPNTGATNESGFTDRPGGGRWDTAGDFYGIGNLSSILFETNVSPYFGVFGTRYNSTDIQNVTATGAYIRCIKDNAIDPGFVEDIDGNIYHTVKIGTQVWMVENLMVKKFSNGDAIPNVTADSEWATLDSPAWCAYNNDNNNI